MKYRAILTLGVLVSIFSLTGCSSMKAEQHDFDPRPKMELDHR